MVWVGYYFYKDSDKDPVAYLSLHAFTSEEKAKEWQAKEEVGRPRYLEQIKVDD